LGLSQIEGRLSMFFSHFWPVRPNEKSGTQTGLEILMLRDNLDDFMNLFLI
jgi:hypothetical protein